MSDSYRVLRLISKTEQKLFTEALKFLDRGDKKAAVGLLRELIVRGYTYRRKPEVLLEILAAYRVVLRRADEQDAFGDLWEQFARNLMGETPHRVELFSSEFDESDHLRQWREVRDGEALFSYHFARGMLHYLYDEYEEAETHLRDGSAYVKSGAAKLLRDDHGRLYSLARMHAGRAVLFASGGAITRAEKARLRGKIPRARRLYAQALTHARREGDGLLQAMVQELEGRFHLRNGRRKFGRARLAGARDAYGEWGAHAKVLQLEQTHGMTVTRGGDHEVTLDATTHTSSTGTGAARVELSHLMEDSRSLTEEIVFEDLTRRIVGIVLNRSGAERCVLKALPANGKELYVEGTEQGVRVFTDENSSRPLLPDEVLERVRIANDFMTLKDTRDENIARDYKPPSGNPIVALLCAPLLRRGELLGILYLESTQDPDLFTAANIEAIRVLSAQAAISLGNAGLYAELEEKVAARSRELNGALKDVRALKEKQDGDYFLTSLLTTPLMEVAAGSERVLVDSRVRQKKQFKFRKWEAELGGDINIAHSLRLANRPCTVFLNADAMGKSIQGAGGVLVVGAVFASIIKRTRHSKTMAARSPKEWIENTVVDLHRVFESFDGSMLISVVLGVVDDESGMLYYVAAEHPRVVLYRGGKADFLEPTQMHAKLGMPGVPDLGVIVDSLRMQPGDVIISGTDGRDDISLGRDEFNQQMINEDETAFLRAVEEGKGELEPIHQVLLDAGELIDDIAMLRVEYTGTGNGES